MTKGLQAILTHTHLSPAARPGTIATQPAATASSRGVLPSLLQASRSDRKFNKSLTSAGKFRMDIAGDDWLIEDCKQLGDNINFQALYAKVLKTLGIKLTSHRVM